MPKLKKENVARPCLTNRLGLPQQFVDAVEFIRGQYNKGKADFSATELLQPPRVRRLRQLHAHEITEDVADLLFSFYGSLNHLILERNTENGAEERYFADYDGNTVSGAIDYQEDGYIYDYKFTTINKALYPDNKEYQKQLNVYADLLKKNGKEVKGLKVILIFRDHKKITEANCGKYPFSSPKYPKDGAMTIPLRIKKHPITENFIKERIAIHKKAETELPACTVDETWFRNGYSHRCEDYCDVSKWCTQFSGGE